MPNADPPRRPSFGARLQALVRGHTRLFAVCVVLGGLLGVGYGYLGAHSYTAETRLLVGSFEAPSQAIPGYVLASQTVAGNYARLAGSTAVEDKIPDDLSLTPAQVVAATTVSAVPESAIIRVVSTGSTADDARTASEAMAAALNDAVAELNTQSGSDAALAEYQAALTELAQATTAQTAAEAALAQASATSGATSQAATDAANAVAQAKLTVQTAQLKVDGLRTRYETQQASVSTSSRVRILGGASVSEPSRMMPALTYGVVGAAAGFVVALVMAGLGRRRGAGRSRDDGATGAEPGDDDLEDEPTDEALSGSGR